MNEIPRKTRLAVIERDGNKCRMCGAQGTEIQHRMRRREGGHQPSNLYRICSTDHRRVHANPTWAIDRGFTVSAVQDLEPAQMPLWTQKGWVLLHDDYTETTIAPANVRPLDLDRYLEQVLEQA
jgi:hypothetical protein